ncbi:MAG TPA: ATP-binding protein [Propionibacteriaceae bacterium]|jgi:signal transduction histidine kinase
MTVTALPTVASGSTSAAPLIRVLFADDSAAIRTLARYSLSVARGFSVVAEAADGAEALELFDLHQPDCVVLDIEMPCVGGIEALIELHRRRPEVPVIMLSGFSDESVMNKAKAHGAAAYLEKSSELGSLPDTIIRLTQAASSAAASSAAAAAAASSAASVAAGAGMAAPVAGHRAATVSVADEMRRLEYVISHDFAEPARIISGFASLLSSRYGESLDDSGRMFLGHILGGTHRMQGMIDDLLAYARASRLEPRSEPVDVRGIVAQLEQELAGQLAERGGRLDIGPLPTVCGDPAIITTVLRHLLVNALTFNRSERPWVRVQGSVVDGTAVCTVTDNGIGVALEHQQAVFELFRRLNTRDEYPGTGTGLTLCRRLLDLLGGTITLDSTPGDGTTVTFTLPATQPHVGEKP